MANGQADGGHAESSRHLAQLANRHHFALLAAILCGAFLIRAGTLSDIEQTIYADSLMPDEATYHAWATRRAEGTSEEVGAPDFPVLPAVVFGAVYSLFGADPGNLRRLNLVLGVALCALAYVLGRVLYGPTAGLCAAALCACCESLAFHSVTAMKTNLGLTLFAGVMILGLWSVARPEARLWAKLGAAGALTGLLANVRANAAIVGFALVPLALWSAWSARPPAQPRLAFVARGAAPFLVAYAVCAASFGGLSGPRFAWNLYMGNNRDNPTPYFQPVRFTSSAPEYQSTGFVVEASRRAGRTLAADEAERFWTATVVDQAMDDPLTALGRLGRKGLAVIHRSGADNNHDLDFVGELLPTLRWALLPSWLLIALGLASAGVLPRDRRLFGGALAFGLYAATLVVFFAGERLRAPLVWLAAPFAGAAIVEVARALRAHRLRPCLASAAIAIAVALAAHAPLAHADDLAGAYNMHALILFDRGELDDAATWYRRSLALGQPQSEGARIGLAAIAHRRGELDDAVALLTPLPDSHYEAASKYEWLGNLALARGRPRDALAAYEKAIEFDSSKQNAYKGLFIAHRLLGEREAAAAVDRRLRAIRAVH